METSDFVELMPYWPQPGTGNDGPIVRFGHGPAQLAYETPDEQVAVVTVPACLHLVCGSPNDEALEGHPLFASGLKFYSVHRVANSSRVAAMERANSAHPRHNPVEYLKDKEHWVFTFQDCTVEFIAIVSQSMQPSFTVCGTWKEANALLARAAA